MLKRFSLIGITCVVLTFGVRKASGQAITGTMTGSVLDASGAAIAGANVTAKNTDTGFFYLRSP